MEEYIRQWLNEFSDMPSLDIHDKKISVWGIIDKHLGPRTDFCKVKVSVESNPQFVVNVSKYVDEKLNDDYKSVFINNAIWGLLDILMVSKRAPITKIKIIFEEVEYNKIESSPFAFREAGRDAGKKILKELFHSEINEPGVL